MAASIENQIAGMETSELTEHLKRLRSQLKVAVSRVRQIGSKGADAQIAELKTRLQMVRNDYFNVDLRTHPNVVVACMGRLQGQELEIKTQLTSWRDARNVKEDIDKQIKICEKVLSERQK